MGDPQGPFEVPLDPRVRLLKPARMVLDQYAIAEAGEAGADDTEAGRMAQRIEDAIGHSVTDVQPTAEWRERVAAWEAAVTADRKALARVRDLADSHDRYATACEADVNLPHVGEHWRQEAHKARDEAKRIRHALGL